MKEKIRQVALYCGVPFLVFCGVFTTVVLTSPSPPLRVGTQNNSVYVSPTPAPASFILRMAGGEVCVQLDFDLNCTHIYSPDEPIMRETESYIDVPDSALAKIIDRFGGADIALPFIADEFDNLRRHYTGSQLCALLTSENISESDKYELRILIIFELFSNISKTGLKGSDFQYIINLCKSNISYIEYFEVRNNLPEVFSHCDYIG